MRQLIKFRYLFFVIVFTTIGIADFVVAVDNTYIGPHSSISLYGPTQHGDRFKQYKHVNPNAQKGGTLTLQASGTFDSLNPFMIKGTPARGLSPLYASLFYATLMDQSFNEPFSQYGYLAKTVELASDKKSVTYVIREGATFHDGSLITIDDVIYSFETLVKDGLPFFKQYYGDVVRIDRVNDVTVTFHFKDDKNKELHMLLGTFPILSKAYHEKYGFESNLKIPVGSGPYHISKVDAGRAIEYERVKKWWGEGIPVNVGRYNFDTIRYIYFRDPDVAFEAFKSHDYDIRIENEIKKWMTGYDEEVLSSGRMQRLVVETVQAGIMNGLVMNTRRAKFKDRNVRRAMILAFDFEWLNKNFFFDQYQRTTSYFWGLDLASSGPISTEEKKLLYPYKDQVYPKVISDIYTLPITDGSGRDRQFLQQAKLLLKEAGYDLKGGRLVNLSTNQPFEIEILLPQQNMTRFLNAYIKSLRRLGIIANFRIVDTAQYTARVEDFDFDMIIAPSYQSNSPGNEQREFWGSAAATQKGSRNVYGLENPVVDQIIEGLIDAQTRDDLMLYTKVLDRLLLWENLVVPLWGSQQTRVAYWSRTVKDNRFLKHTGDFSNYNFDIYSWWSEASPD